MSVPLDADPAVQYRFGSFVLSPPRRVLLQDGVEVRLIPRYFDLLRQTSGELKARMTSLESSLRGHARSASFGAGLTLLLGVVLLAGLGFYFWYGFNVIGGFLSEKEAANNILGIVEGQLNENLDPARKYLEGVVKETRRRGPNWLALRSARECRPSVNTP